MSSEQAAGPLVITRTFELELDPDELWSLAADGARWPEWLVDEASVVVAPGARGTVDDDGVERQVRVLEVDPGRSVRFDWWPDGRPDLASTVSFEIDSPDGSDRSGTSRLRVIERLPAPPTTAAGSLTAACSAAACSMTWEVRVSRAWLSSLTLARR